MTHSLQCPQCDGAFTVNDRDAGTRVKCPHCQKTFVAPGSVKTSNDDDDWLRLDDDQPVSPRPVEQTPATDAPDDIDDFAEIDEPLPVSEPAGNPGADDPLFGNSGAAENPSGGDLGEDVFGDLPPMDIPPLAPPPPRASPDPPDASIPGLGPPVTGAESSPPPAAAPTEYQSEFRLYCKVCGSLLYAKASQEGRSIKCGDCHSMIVVPPPPKVKQTPEIDLERAETFGFEQPPEDARREDPFRKSAEDLLKDAEGHEPEKTAEYFDAPSVVEWVRSVFGIFTDLNVTLRLIMFTLVGAIPAYFALAMDSPIAILGLFVGGALFAAPVIACGFAILQAVANGEPSVEDWPSMDPMEWLGSAGIAFAAVGFAGVPVLVLSQMVFDNTLIIVALTMLSIYIMFPFVLLSMLDMQTITMPFSPEVARSVTSSQESWGGFYFSAGLLFCGLFLLFVATSGGETLAAALINVGGTVALVFTYFAMIGRLAFAIGQSVNAPPREPDDGKEAPPKPPAE